MTYDDVKELIQMIDESTLTEFQLTMDNVSVQMSKNAREMEKISSDASLTSSTQTASKADSPIVEPVRSTTTAEKPKVEDQSGEMVKAPIVGTFYSAPGADKPAFVKVGDTVKEGDTLCILEAMKIMNEIVSPCDGEVVEIYVANEDMVEYGQPLFRIK